VFVQQKVEREAREETKIRHSGIPNSRPPWLTEDESYYNEEAQSTNVGYEDEDYYGMFLQRELEENSPQKREQKSYATAVVQSSPKQIKDITPPPPLNSSNKGDSSTKNKGAGDKDKPYQQKFIIQDNLPELKLTEFNTDGWNKFTFDVKRRRS
jgi:hypothetical protein